MSLGTTIQNKRTAMKLSQEYLAEQLDISRQAVSKWETDQSEPSVSNLIRLAELFDCDVEEIVSPEKFSDKQEKDGKSVTSRVNKNINMQLAGVFGRVILLVGFLGFIGAYNYETSLGPMWYENVLWGGVFVVGLVLTFIASKDYFYKQNGSRRIVWFDFLFILSFFLYQMLPSTEKGIDTLVVLLYGAIIISIINIKFFIPIWRRNDHSSSLLRK